MTPRETRMERWMRTHPERVAWVVIWTSFALFLLLVGGSAYGARRWWESRTGPQTARLTLVQREAVLIRRALEAQPRPAADGALLKPGDAILVLPDVRGPAAFLTLLDGAPVQLFADTELILEESRATLHNRDRAWIRLRLERGSIRWGVPPLSAYRAIRYEVRTPAATVLLDPDGSYYVEHREGRTAVAVRRGRAWVVAGGGSVEVREDQRTEVQAGGRPTPPQVAYQELLVNGDFSRELEGWSPFHDQGGDGGSRDGEFFLVEEEIGARRVRAVRFLRQGGNTDYAAVGIRQTLNLDVTDFTELLLSAQVKVRSHSLSGGGVLGWEYPLILRVRYRGEGGEGHDAFYGFYVHNEENLPVPYGIQVPSGVWQEFAIDLLQVSPRPLFLEYLDVYAAGHDYFSEATEISLKGKR